MPIYEFRCSSCNESFELLKMGKDNSLETRCPYCSSDAFERIISTVSYSMSGGSGKARQASVQTRNCAGGACTTLDFPGPN